MILVRQGLSCDERHHRSDQIPNCMADGSSCFSLAHLSGMLALGAHTHTASDITDFDNEVSDNPSVTANTTKISADGSIDSHSDVDTSTTLPTDGQTLVWDTDIWKS